jgi:hypothetical protein
LDALVANGPNGADLESAAAAESSSAAAKAAGSPSSAISSDSKDAIFPTAMPSGGSQAAADSVGSITDPVRALLHKYLGRQSVSGHVMETLEEEEDLKSPDGLGWFDVRNRASGPHLV